MQEEAKINFFFLISIQFSAFTFLHYDDEHEDDDYYLIIIIIIIISMVVLCRENFQWWNLL